VASVTDHALAILVQLHESVTHRTCLRIMTEEGFAHPASGLGLENSSVAELTIVEMGEHKLGGVGGGRADAAGRGRGYVFKSLRLVLAVFPLITLRHIGRQFVLGRLAYQRVIHSERLQDPLLDIIFPGKTRNASNRVTRQRRPVV